MEKTENKPRYQIVVVKSNETRDPLPIAESDNQYQLVELLYKLAKNFSGSTPEAIGNYKTEDIEAGHLMAFSCYDSNFNSLHTRLVLKTKPV